MKVTEPKFSDKQNRMEEAEDTQKSAAIKPLQEIQRTEQVEKSLDQQVTYSVFQKTEESPVTMSKEAPGKRDEPEQRAEENLVATLETAPNDPIAPDKQVATLSQPAPEIPARPPVAPRKNIIPPRRTAFENSNRAAHVSKKTWVPDNLQGAEISQQPVQAEAPSEMDAPEGNLTQQPQATTRDAADQPTASIPPVISQSAQTDGRGEQQGLAASMPASWQAAPVMPISWQATPEMPASWQPDQDAPTLAEAEPAWTDEGEHEKTRRDEEHIKQTAAIETQKIAVPMTPIPAANTQIKDLPRTPVPTANTRMSEQPTTPLPMSPTVKPLTGRGSILTRGRAAFLILLLVILVINVTSTGFSQFFGPRGWGSVFNSSSGTGQNLLGQLHLHAPTPGTRGQPTATPLTPTQIADKLLASMTLDEKLGQMMMVQFTGSEYSLQLSAMLSQYHVGSVLIFAANGNVVSKPQLKGLISQMQQNAFLPLSVSIDQEGGYVDRLRNLDGPQPAAATIGASGDPNQAYQQGIKDAQDLAYYGINLNLAPVVDVNNVYNPQLYDRTFGSNPTIVTQMAGAYLRGLQQGGKVLGTLKHFPGLGDVSVDPHFRPPDLTRSLNDLNAIDWAPYSALIKQGNVYAIMVTHEYVKALDSSEPSSLSPQVIGILRNQMHFQGVIMTDSLTMDSIHNYYSYGQAAAKAIEAGDDMLMGATSPNDVAAMIDGIKQAISSGAISEQQIDNAVRRILVLKCEMGLLQA